MDSPPSSSSQPSTSLNAPIIGLAGGIGAGKSRVAAILRDLGCVVSESDREVREILEDPRVRDTLVDWWGESILDPHGRVDRRAIADLVFADEARRHRLESLIHPLVEQRRLAEWRRIGSERRVPAFVIDAPLLFEAGLDAQCDAVIFVDADRSIRLDRVKRHRGWSEEELSRREKNQWPLDIKRERSDYLISNDGDVEALERRVEAVFHRILQSHSSPPAGRGRRS